MKTITTTFLVFIFSNTIAQNPIQNPSFENWTNGTPDHWQTNNDTGLTRIMATPFAHSGNFGVKGYVIMGPSGGQFIPPTATYIDSSASGTFYDPFDQMSIYVAYTPWGTTESFAAVATMLDSSGNVTRLGSVDIEQPNATATYSQYVCPLFQLTNNPSTKIVISIYISDTQGLIQGASFQADDVEFSLSSGTNQKPDRNFDVKTENGQLYLKNQREDFYTISVFSLDGKLLENIFSGNLKSGDFSFFSNHITQGKILSIRTLNGKVYTALIR